ncbi:MAG TPA: sigma-70 family RNA polymerase sigma factor [Acidobacteriaceae bacterium]|nr:sigma-70 family RNA polymerase sigma factor [Acidobacteriaceae bacterium]
MERQPPRVEDDDQQAIFARLATEHGRFLYRIAWSVLRHAEDAEDCVQETLLKLYRGESWRQMTNERAFLCSVVWRLAIDRRSVRRSGAEDSAELQFADSRPTPEAAAADHDERQLLRELIAELPDELRDTVRLSALEELNSREIGDVLGIPEGTVRTRLMRARAELQTRWTARRRAAISSR